MESVHEEVVGNYKIKIIPDSEPMNPREEFDHLGTMICFHRRYTLGDKHNMSLEEAQEFFYGSKDVIGLPLFLYDHSGITMSTSVFSCPWDSVQV